MSISGFILPDWPAPANVRALATMRVGGISQGAYAELNLGDHVGDVPDAVAGNRTRLIESAVLPAPPCWLQQEHGTQGVEATADNIGARADWSWAERSGRICAVLTADCLPLLICEQQGRLVAAVHAGWRGLCAGVIDHAIGQFVAAGVAAGDILVWLGPAIGASAYEVDAPVYEAFATRCPAGLPAFTAGAIGHWQLDLYAAARAILTEHGVTACFGGDFCTFSDARFYSHRREAPCGRQASLIWLEN